MLQVSTKICVTRITTVIMDSKRLLLVRASAQDTVDSKSILCLSPYASVHYPPFQLHSLQYSLSTPYLYTHLVSFLLGCTFSPDSKIVSRVRSKMEVPQSKYHFVLVHGSCHGAWSYYKLIDRLQKAGHQVTALDFAGCGTHPANPDTIATYEEYNQPLIDFFESVPEDDSTKVVLVAHSMGGLHSMLLMEQFSHKIGLAIFIAAIILPAGKTLMDAGKLSELIFNDTPNSKALDYNFGQGPDKPPTSFYIRKSELHNIFYTDWSSEDVVLGSILTRPYPLQLGGIPITTTKEKFGSVPLVYVKYLRDATLPVAAQHWITENMGPFKEVVEIDGGHFNFHVKPDEFTQLLCKVAHTHFQR